MLHCVRSLSKPFARRSHDALGRPEPRQGFHQFAGVMAVEPPAAMVPTSATRLAGARLGELYRVDYLDRFQIRVGQELMEVLLKLLHVVCLSLMFPVQYT
jgi:hypothetical protein